MEWGIYPMTGQGSLEVSLQMKRDTFMVSRISCSDVPARGRLFEVDQAFTECVLNQLGAGVEPKLVHDILAVPLDSLDRDR